MVLSSSPSFLWGGPQELGENRLVTWNFFITSSPCSPREVLMLLKGSILSLLPAPYSFLQFLAFWDSLTMQSWNSVCRPDLPWMHRDPPASASECWAQRLILPFLKSFHWLLPPGPPPILLFFVQESAFPLGFPQSFWGGKRECEEEW